MKKCTPLWREAPFQVKMYKTPQRRTTFGSCDVEKVHAVVARSTFPSQNVQNTPCSDHFWKLRCRKSARRCGPKHISKSKCTKHLSVGPLLEVAMSKKCTPLWREDARSTFPSQNVQNTSASDHFWKLRCRKSARRCGAKHLSKSKCTKHLSVGPLLEVAMSKKCTPLWREAHFQVKMYKTHHARTTFGGSDVSSRHFTTTDDITLHYTPLRYTPQHYNYNYAATLHYTKLHYTTLHSTTRHYTTLHYLPLHLTTSHYITLHYTALYYNYNCTTTLHYTTLHYTTQPSTTLDYITLHYTTLHYTTTTTTQLHSTTLHYTKLH